MSTNPNPGVADLATGTLTQPDEVPIDWSEWIEVDPGLWPDSWPDDELILTDEVEPCHS